LFCICSSSKFAFCDMVLSISVLELSCTLLNSTTKFNSSSKSFINVVILILFTNFRSELNLPISIPCYIIVTKNSYWYYTYYTLFACYNLLFSLLHVTSFNCYYYYYLLFTSYLNSNQHQKEKKTR
jgi:hypothetical protein